MPCQHARPANLPASLRSLPGGGTARHGGIAHRPGTLAQRRGHAAPGPAEARRPAQPDLEPALLNLGRSLLVRSVDLVERVLQAIAARQSSRL